MDNNLENSNVENVTVENSNVENMTREPLSSGGQKKSGKKWIALGAVILAVVIAAVMLVPSMVMGKRGKIVKALENTFTPDAFMEEVLLSEGYRDGNYTVTLEGSADVEGKSGAVKMTAAMDREKKKAFMNINASFDSYQLDGAVAMADGQIRLSSDSIIPENEVLVYHYNEDVTGYLKELAKESDFDLDKFNEQLTKSLENTADSQWVDKLTQATKDAFDELEFEDAKEKEYTINGEKQSCTGYTTTIQKEWVEKLIASYKSVFLEYTKENAEEETGKLFEGLKELPETLDKSVLGFYLYDGKIAAITFETKEDVTFSLLCEGGESEEKFVLTGGEDRIEITRVRGKDDKTVEYHFGNGKEEVFSVSFDRKTKALQCQVGIDEDTVTLRMIFSPDAEFPKEKEGLEEVNLNSIDENAFEELVQNIATAYYSVLYGF